MEVATYTQPLKEAVRRELIEHAVHALTEGRQTSALVRPDEYRTTLDYALGFLKKHGLVSGWEDEAQAIGADWLSFRDAVVGTRQASDLKVLYLSGPEPMNDLGVLLELGVRPQHLWAVEGGRNEYGAAVKQLGERSSFIRLHHGSLRTFLDEVTERFDIVVYDACGPFGGGKPNTLGPLVSLFREERLSPMGALITNFTSWPEEQADQYDLLMARYFNGRHDEVPRPLLRRGVDPAGHIHGIADLARLVGVEREQVYSEFVTLLVAEVARDIIPLTKVGASTALQSKYFAKKSVVNDAVKRALHDPDWPNQVDDVDAAFVKWFEAAGDVARFPGSYPLLSFLVTSDRDPATSRYVSALMQARVYGKTIGRAYPYGVLLAQIMNGHVEVASEEMRAAVRAGWFDYGRRYFCDVPLPKLLINLLFGIYSHPYLANPRKSLRLRYRAKVRPMFADCHVFDQCRYVYDYLPTIDLIPYRWESKAFQLALRVHVDRMGWHGWHSKDHPFRGSALGGRGEHEVAQPYGFPKRELRAGPEDSERLKSG